MRESDLPIFFEQQLDPTANHMAAFTRKDPTDRDAFPAHWTNILGNDTVSVKTILLEGQVAGSVLSFVQFDEPEISYWIGMEYWGKGIANKELSDFLKHITMRSLYARAAKDNIASIRVLEKCDFNVTGQDKVFSMHAGRRSKNSFSN